MIACRWFIGGLVSSGALMAAQGTNGMALDYPAYEQEVMATFATPEEASAATCAIAPLPDDARVACSCRWDDTNPKHLSKAEMMTRVGVKGSFYFVGSSNPFFADGARKLMALGHAIGNHTLSHGQMMTLGLNEGFRQIAANRILLETTIQHTVNSYVSPFGWSTDPLDAGHAKTLAEALVASGHFVSEDAQMSWSGLPATTWMWTNRFSSDDRNPQRKLFEEGFARSLAAAFRNPDVPRVTLGTHSWCDAAGEARQEEWLREFFLRDDAVRMNDWEYGAYRYQYLNGGVRKEGTAGAKATFRVRRFAAAHVGDAIPLSLRFSVRPQAVTCGTKPLARQPRGTWALAQDELRAKMPRIARAEDGVLEVEPDEQAATITVRFSNRTGKTLRDLFVAAALPPKWSVRRVCTACGELKPGACFERTFSMGRIGRNDYAYGVAYYPASLDFVCDGQPHRLWADRTTDRMAIPDDAPVKSVRIWGPGKASVLAAVDWTQVSHPGAELPDAAAWMRPVGSEDALATIVAPPISIRPGRNGNAAVREVLKGEDHARYAVYDFTAGSDGMRSFRCNADPKYRSPVLYLNGKRLSFTGDGQIIPVKKGRNRLVLRADACAGRTYTKPLYMDVSSDVTRIFPLLDPVGRRTAYR